MTERQFPMRETGELLALAADIQAGMAGGSDARDYVRECMKPAAKQALDDAGDSWVSNYRLSTVIHCADRMATDLDTLGYIRL